MEESSSHSGAPNKMGEKVPDPKTIVEKWRALHDKNELCSKHLKDYWKYFVPDILSPQPHCNCLRITYDEERIQKILIDPLVKFMFGENPPASYQMIRDLHNPPSFCGKVFKSGDPTYGCRDCGMDPTCVLCVQCFKNSAHNKHRYKISTSSGGGYCDCGDKEAWKNDVFCHTHIKGELAESQGQNILERLPNDMVERVQFIYDSILQYAKQLLTHEDNMALPSDLEVADWSEDPNNPNEMFNFKDTYVTMLYNDETHTYDQVIHALMKAIECSKRDAVSFATTIDREGRCIVRCATFHQCNRAKGSMDKLPFRNSSKMLKVQVVHASIIAHQVFASRLLQWLHNDLEEAQAFRLIFTEIATRDNCELIESIFRADTQMWKCSRIQWHRLFMSGMLMEVDSKKVFARVFTKHYGKMMKDFIQDDHEHSVCVVSLAVQIYTIPTIAHMLIAEEDVLARLLTTFLSECKRNISNDKLSLDPRSQSINTFKRIQYILYDLKYLLCFKPDNWTSELKRGFLHGFESLLQLLTIMQGMDPVIRQLGQHMEFEPEWESAFNLHIKLSSILPLVIEWAASNRVVLIKAYRMLLKTLGQQTTESMRRRYARELLNYSVYCIEYDVSTAPVSLHLPLSRLVAGLTIHLDKYELNYNSVEFGVKGKPLVEELMEPVLRTQVMISQVNAGMWRRNGYSLSNQIYFYHNVRCRQEMLDRDIMLLQEAASLMDSNEFLIHLLNRFNLINWARKDYELKGKDEDNTRQVVILAEEFLQLVMVLIAERYTTGIGVVTEEDCIQKEIIQLLCIESLPHSILNKELPEGVNHETGIEKVIDKVAAFKKNSGEAKGYFELKEEYYKAYNLFFYHYSREDQSKSEVAQRSRKKNSNEEICCPPPIPPPFTEPFTLLVNILQCDIFLHIAHVVLSRIHDQTSQSASEVMLQVVLHMIGYALHEEERYVKNDDPYFHFTSKAPKYSILPLLESAVGIQRTATHKDMLLWTIRRYHSVLNLSSNSNSSSKNKILHMEEGSVGCSNSEGLSRTASSASSDKKRKAEVAERKAMIMAKMANMQKSFITKNKNLFSVSLEASASEISPADMPPTSMDFEEETRDLIAVGPNQSFQHPATSSYTCILCHQEVSVTASSDDAKTSSSMVLGALVQKSSILSRKRTRTSQQRRQMRHPEHRDTLVLDSDLSWGTHMSSCGHAMHAQCWRRYFDDVANRERRKPHRGQNLSFDIEKNEYLCPLCESLCNTALPLLPSVMTIASRNTAQNLAMDFATWIHLLRIGLESKVVVPKKEPSKEELDEKTDAFSPMSSKSSFGRLPWSPESSSSSSSSATAGAAASSSTTPPISLAEKIGTVYELHPLEYTVENILMDFSKEVATEFVGFCDQGNRPEFSSLATEMISGFTVSIYCHGLGVDPDHLNPRILETIWTSAAYTLRVIEANQRCAKNALLSSLSARLSDSLTALVKFAAYAPCARDSKKMAEMSTLRLLSAVIESPCEKSLCLLEWDAFSVMVSLSLGLPSIFPRVQSVAHGSNQELFVLQLTFFSHLVQVLLLLDERCYRTISMDVEDHPMADLSDADGAASPTATATPTATEGEEQGSSPCDASFVKDLLTTLRDCLNLPPVAVDATKLLECVKQQCLPFLRCCAIFFHFLTEIKAPEELSSAVWVPESEFLCILRYLGLDTHLQNIFNKPVFKDILVTRWLRHPKLMECLAEKKLEPCGAFGPFTHINELVQLPQDYSELMNMVAQVPCPASIGDDSRTPTMCLICGDMLCSQSYCCQMELPENSQKMVGACTYHANFCGAGTGVFLRVRECRILLLSGRIKGCFFPPPYLDDYGETDGGLKRGNPLHLAEHLYSKLRTTWLSHSIPDVIAHTMESSNNLVINEWFHF